MRKSFLYLVLFFLAVLMQASLFSSPVARAVPSLLAPLLLSLALWEEHPGMVVTLSFLAGLLLDLVSSTPLGVNALTFLLLGAGALAIQRFFFAIHFPLWLLLVLVYDLVARTLSTALVLLCTGMALPGALFLDNLLFGFLFTGLCSIPLYPLCRLLRPKRSSERLQVLS